MMLTIITWKLEFEAGPSPFNVFPRRLKTPVSAVYDVILLAGLRSNESWCGDQVPLLTPSSDNLAPGARRNQFQILR